MRPRKARKPFTLFQKETQAGPVWYARFWNETARRYAVTRSTGVPVEGKRQRRYEAEQAARSMLPLVTFTPTGDKTFTRYVADFWANDSPYVRECALVKKKPLSADYVTMNRENVRRHMEPFPGFKGVTLRGLTAGIVRDWMAWAAGNGLSGRVINTVLLGMRVAVRYAVAREDLSGDPFRNIKNAREERREKGILTPAEVSRIITAPAEDAHARLAVLLGVLCGMRRGEVRGLQWGDIDNGLITVQHNYQENEGLKAPKCGSKRTVPVPGSVQSAISAVRALYGEATPEGFVMINPLSSEKPLSPKYFQRALQTELSAVGIPEKQQRARNLTFHGLRHTFVTLGRMAGISDLEIQALAGQGPKMMERYSHASQALDFGEARRKIEAATKQGQAAGNA
ncbi:MAG: site-specific integrase [Treponema sp.]|jgi:integrase|nr:site-specific integrase [Treponema sp.]